MLTLGFSTQYYTLWEVSEPFKKYGAGIVLNGVFTGDYTMVQNCDYIQNLSMDYDAAIAKITERSNGKFNIDLELRGHYSFIRSGSQGNDMPDYVFSFGQLMGQDIRTATDVWQLKRAMKEERGARRKVYARRRLVDLGVLVKNTIGLEAGNDSFITTSHFRYVSEKLAKKSLSGHFYENGKRTTLSVKRIGGVSYDTQYGTVYIEEYLTDDGKIVKYKGSSPLRGIEDDFVSVVSTIEHSEYNGTPETRLKRPKFAPVEKKLSTCEDLEKFLHDKFPTAHEINCHSMQSGPYASVYTDTEELTYQINNAGIPYKSNSRKLTPTEISVRKQPFDHIIVLTGDSEYKGQYYKGTAGDGYLHLTSDKDEAHKMRASVANEVRSYVCFHSQYCYGKKFEIQKVN